MNTQQQIQNCETFLKNWANIKPEQVMPELVAWNEDFNDDRDLNESSYKHTCNTIACAGGWLSAMPEFQAMGVTLESFGAGSPMMVHPDTGGVCDSDEIQEVLFGAAVTLSERTPALFDPRWNSEKGTDHEVVTNRFETQIELLKARL